MLGNNIAQQFHKKERLESMKKLLLLVLIFLMVATGCSESTVSTISDPSHTALPAEQELWNFPNLRLCTEQSLEGLYQIESLRQGSCNILYLDYASAQMFPLCDVPNCDHASETCTSYIALHENQMPPMVLTNGDHIFIMTHGASETQNASIQIADKSGKNRHTLFEASSGESLGAALYTDSQAVYFEVFSTEEIDGDLKQVDSLIQVNLNTEKVQVLAKLYDQVIYGEFNDGFLVNHYEESSNGVVTVGYYRLNIPKNGDPFWLDSSPVYQSDKDSGSYIMNNRICVYHYDTNIFSVTEGESGETREVDCSGLVSEYKWGTGREPSVSELSGDYYRLEVPYQDENGNFPTKKYVIDLASGTISPLFTLQIESVGGKNVALMGEYQDQFCVVYDYVDKAITYNGESGLETGVISIPQYAMMKKSDYFQSVPNYKPVQDFGITW